MTRLLMTADAVGGVWTYALELARGLEPFGVATTIATMGPQPTSHQIAAAAAVPRLELVTSSFRLEWMDGAWADVDAAAAWLLDLEARVRPAVVHLNGYALAARRWRAPVVVAAHSCVSSWAEAVGDPIDAAWLDRYRFEVSAGLCAADWVIAPSEAMRSLIRRHYGRRTRTSVVANGRDPQRFPPGDKEPLIVAAGRLRDRAKNIEAVAAVAPYLSWPVTMLGDGSATGVVSETELARWLGRAALFVHPARYEPFGLLPLEAALAGCALVLGDIESLREVWDDAAVYVPPDDHRALHAAIEHLIARPSVLADCARRARRRALLYSTERMAVRYWNIYRHRIAPGGLACVS
jgi:glycosyltransferase involved in cell wall biosynthesis